MIETAALVGLYLMLGDAGRVHSCDVNFSTYMMYDNFWEML